jgi:hypothetical protein
LGDDSSGEDGEERSSEQGKCAAAVDQTQTTEGTDEIDYREYEAAQTAQDQEKSHSSMMPYSAWSGIPLGAQFFGRLPAPATVAIDEAEELRAKRSNVSGASVFVAVKCALGRDEGTVCVQDAGSGARLWGPGEETGRIYRRV